MAAIQAGRSACLYLGNLEAKRDWGYAPDYVEGMWRMLQQMEPDDYVLATGEAHSVREFVERCFAHVGRRLEWRVDAGKEEGVDAADGRALVKVDHAYYRPAEVDFLLGDATKARERMGWIPTVGFEELVRIMMDADLAAEAGASG